MNIHDVRLPEDIEQGAVGGPGFKTTIVTLANGAEQRNQDWQVTRASYDVGYGVQDVKGLRAVEAFFRARRGKAYGFRFKDWYDFQAVNQPTIPVVGFPDRRQLVKVYPDEVNAYTRKLYLPVDGTLTVYIDTLATDNYTLLPDGQLQFLGDVSGYNINATFEFDVPVRFDLDRLPINMANIVSGSIAGIGLVELRP